MFVCVKFFHPGIWYLGPFFKTRDLRTIAQWPNLALPLHFHIVYSCFHATAAAEQWQELLQRTRVPQSPKCLLFGPLQRKVADTWFKA